ncbi:minor capsid protein [Lacticaseibacillus absianus]|uniref:minor capsid protein n=1 Tax=Lacticaseibacillus absianus TaxID=2729623 RepID=UPI0015C9E02F|nr:minor capsid protein [Lacticaseibacillus absianus]
MTTVGFGAWAGRLADPGNVTGELAYKVREGAEPFVPASAAPEWGYLASDSVNVLDAGANWTIVYGAPYAHYVFVGKVLVGHKPKHPNGEALNYFKGNHSNAGPDWIERAADANMAGWETFVVGRLIG